MIPSLNSFEGSIPFSSIRFSGRGGPVRDGNGGMVGRETVALWTQARMDCMRL